MKMQGYHDENYPETSKENFEESETWNPRTLRLQVNVVLLILGSILSTFAPQTTSLIAKAQKCRAT